jgi:hypothetical protein
MKMLEGVLYAEVKEPTHSKTKYIKENVERINIISKLSNSKDEQEREKKNNKY